MVKKLTKMFILLFFVFSSTLVYCECSKNISGNWFLYIYDIYDDTCGNNLFGFEKFLDGTGALITATQNQCDVNIDTYFPSSLPKQTGTMIGDNLTTDFTINLSSVGLTYDVNTNIGFSDYSGEGIADFTANASTITCTFKSHVKFVKVALLSADSEGSGNIPSVSKEKVDALKSGWTLMGTCGAITDMTMFNGAKTVWGWSGSSWMIYSPLEAVKNLMKSYSITPLTSIPANSGFWVNK